MLLGNNIFFKRLLNDFYKIRVTENSFRIRTVCKQTRKKIQFDMDLERLLRTEQQEYSLYMYKECYNFHCIFTYNFSTLTTTLWKKLSLITHFIKGKN